MLVVFFGGAALAALLARTFLGGALDLVVGAFFAEVVLAVFVTLVAEAVFALVVAEAVLGVFPLEVDAGLALEAGLEAGLF